MFDFNVVPLSKQIWPKTWLLNAPKFLGCNRGTISIKRIIWDWTWQLNTLGKICRLAQVERATSATPRLLKHIALARWHRAGSIFLNEKNEKKTRKHWASYVTLSWRTNVKPQTRIHNMYWPGWWRHTELAQGHVAGSIFCFFFIFFRSKKLSQLRGAEPATRHWASNEALSQQRGNGESVLYGTDEFSDAAFAVPTNQIIDLFWHQIR